MSALELDVIYSKSPKHGHEEVNTWGDRRMGDASRQGHYPQPSRPTEVAPVGNAERNIHRHPGSRQDL